MKRLATALAVGVLAVSGTALAGDEPGAGMEARGKKFEKFLKKAGLSAESITKAKEAWAEWTKTAKALRAELRAKRKELREAFSAETLDQAKIDGLAGEIAAKKGELIKARIANRSKLLAMMTPEQRKKVIAMRMKINKKWRGAMAKMRKMMMGTPAGR